MDGITNRGRSPGVVRGASRPSPASWLPRHRRERADHSPLAQKFGPALSKEIRRHSQPAGTTWLLDETYVNIHGTSHYQYRGVTSDGQVLDCWLSRTRDPAAAGAFFRRTISSPECLPPTRGHG